MRRRMTRGSRPYQVLIEPFSRRRAPGRAQTALTHFDTPDSDEAIAGLRSLKSPLPRQSHLSDTRRVAERHVNSRGGTAVFLGTP